MAKFENLLIGGKFAVGAVVFSDRYTGEAGQNRIVFEVAPQTRADFSAEMIIDTGGPWCILNPKLHHAWGLISETNHEPLTSLWIRGEKWFGHLTRADIVLQADFGENLLVEATFFIPRLQPDEIWNYPNFLGLDGFLNRIRYAVDPSENVFYFGPL